MKTFLSILIFCSLLCSCHPNNNETKGNFVIKEKNQDRIQVYSNPTLIYGSSFGKLFQGFYRNNKYDLMLSFTSNETLKLFGKEKLIDYYKNKFEFDLNLGNLNNITAENEYIILTYANALEFATRKKITIYCVIENDSAKIVLKNLKKFPFD